MDCAEDTDCPEAAETVIGRKAVNNCGPAGTVPAVVDIASPATWVTGGATCIWGAVENNRCSPAYNPVDKDPEAAAAIARRSREGGNSAAVHDEAVADPKSYPPASAAK